MGLTVSRVLVGTYGIHFLDVLHRVLCIVVIICIYNYFN